VSGREKGGARGGGGGVGCGKAFEGGEERRREEREGGGEVIGEMEGKEGKKGEQDSVCLPSKTPKKKRRE